MPLARHPFFRKAIVSWYDSDAACILVIGLMILVLFFGLLGVYVAQGQSDFRGHLWVPVFLVMLSLGVIISTVARMARRR